MKLTLRFFASVREALGTPSDTVELPDSIATVADVRAALVARGGAWAAALGEGRTLRMACNQTMCKPDAAVKEGDEVAFFPPVTGG
ncbi:molybdopterin converting factor subunit 1 [Pseudoduganella ginsengisoli]|uniref:Molybdopterin synthase sulfur carrier subunit n=1 Tax=Pseudoduganella ginsengisoli TaxID=1462440 RepID=A0A6L6Q4P8_9BURK|nr:molybdopterin converting factor subunit 1 [Pseudoduganella ginsengisoli]